MCPSFRHDPATDHELRLADGRRMMYSLIGAPGGTPILSCHGGLLCRFDVEPCADDFAALGLQVLSPDRPGVGGSDRKPGRTTADWAHDVRELLDALAIDQVAVMGWSLGAQYAAGIAALLPDRITQLALIAGCPPLDDPARFKQLNRLDRRLARLSLHARPVARATFVALAGVARRRPLRFARFEAAHSPEADAAVITAHREWLGVAMGEGARDGAGMVDEYRAFVGPWGFAPGAISAPTCVYQGGRDTLVRPSWADELVRMIPGARRVTFPDDGHLIGLSRRAEITAALR